MLVARKPYTLPPIAKPIATAMWIAPIAIFGLSAMWHYLYDLCPTPAVGAVAPVAESVWEHGKIVWYPTFLYWWAVKIARGSKQKGDVLFGVAQTSAMAALLCTFCLYYALHAGLGIGKVLWIDLLAEGGALALSAYLARTVYRQSTLPRATLVAYILCFATDCVLLAICTFAPCPLPIFARLDA